MRRARRWVKPLPGSGGSVAATRPAPAYGPPGTAGGPNGPTRAADQPPIRILARATCRAAQTSSPLGCLFEVVETLVLTLVIFFVIQNFIAQPYQVQQNSMERTLEPGQYVLVDKLTPRWDSYSRGDVVVFNPPRPGPRTRHPFIKRVIGLPGDTVEVKDDGFVYVNGVKLDEHYLYVNDAGVQEPTTASSTRHLGRPGGPAVRDGRPSPEVGRLARLRPDRDLATSSDGHSSATGPSRPSGSSRPRPTPPSNRPRPDGRPCRDARPGPARGAGRGRRGRGRLRA